MFEPAAANAGAAPTITSVAPPPPATLYVLVAAIVLLLAWEAWTLRSKGDQFPTITATVRYWSNRWALIPFLAGVLVRHFWW